MSAPRVAFVQTGDFREAAKRIAVTGKETYNSQRYSMEVVSQLVRAPGSAGVLCVRAAAPYDEILDDGVRVVGVCDGKTAARDRLAALERMAPEAVVLRTPDPAILRFCLRRGVTVFPSLADSFTLRPGLRGLVDRWRFAALGRLLGDPRIPWVANHNLPASRDLVRIGVPADKVIPWDWPQPARPADRAPRAAPTGATMRLLCVGAVSEAKGVGDALRAFGASEALRRRATLTVVGRGDVVAMQALAKELGVADRVRFTGQVAFDEVAPLMRDHDALIVFSRAEYGEGMPGVIYQGLAARLPLLLSTHRIFAKTFCEGEDALFAKAGSPAALAAAAMRLLDDPALYARLSANAETAFAKIEHPVLWGDVVTNWLRRDAKGDAWLRARRLDAWKNKNAGESA